MDIFTICLKEVALEGLDGITLPTLWQRLIKREQKIPVVLTDALKSHLWHYLVEHGEIQFFAMENSRPEPEIFNRFLGRDPSSGSIFAVAPDELDRLVDVYPVKPVTDQQIKGSCLDYKTRIEVTGVVREANMSMEDVSNRFGLQQLVVVASQHLRERALLPPGVHPQIIEELAELEYCILERIARSRWQGEIQTVLNNNVFKNLKTSHIHYVMKDLISKGLVTKQAYVYRRQDKNNKFYQQLLLHHKSFKVEIQTQMHQKCDELCNALEAAPNQTMTLKHLRQFLQMPTAAFRKLKAKLMSQGVIEVVDSDKDNKRHEKELRLLKKNKEKPAVEETEDDPEEAVAPPSGDSLGLVAEMPVVLQCFRYLLSTGEEGCSQLEMLNLLAGYGKLEGRHVCRKIDKAGLTRIIMLERGKLCIQKYIANNFAQNSTLTRQFLAERKKMQENMEISVLSCDEEVRPTDETMDSSVIPPEIQSPNNSQIVNHIEMLVPPTPGNLSCSELNDSTYSEDMSFDTSTMTGKRRNLLTTRRMRRTNHILSFVNEQKAIEGMFPIHKFLCTEEAKLGETSKMCKKTVARTVEKMHSDGLLKCITIPVTCNEVTQDVNFVTSLDCSPSRLKAAVEQAQFRILSNETKKSTKNVAEEMCNTDHQLSQICQVAASTELVKMEDLLPAIDYLEMGFQPKHVRAKAVHCYLWYLAYDHANKLDGDQKMIDYDKVNVYNHELSWKRFLPPVPQHSDYGPGWIQVGEAAFLLPLSVLCQIQRYNYKIPDVEEFLHDPVHKHTLVRHLPEKTKALLFHKRKYMFSLINIIEMLCFMGLATLSTMKSSKTKCLKKEDEMVYIHKNVSILDTTSSDQSYMETSDNVAYEKIRFKLESLNDVEKFWNRMKDVCLITPLGVNNSQDANVEQIRHTVVLKKFIQEHVDRTNSVPKDDGSIPGDGKGAGGFDSSLFSHLYRNWYRSMKSKKTDVENHEAESNANQKNVVRLPRLTSLKIKTLGSTPVKRKRTSTEGGKKGMHSVDGDVSKKKRRKTVHGEETTGAKKAEGTDTEFEVVTESNVGRNERVKGGRGSKRKSTSVNDKPISTPLPRKRRRRRKEKKERVRKKYVDPGDVASLKLLVDSSMGRPRSIFSPDEDAILLVCKIASTLITNVVSPTIKVIPLLAVRDMLRSSCAESRDKTSYACGRRIHVIMKNDHNRISHQVSVAHVMADKEFMKSAFEGYAQSPQQSEPQPAASMRENLTKLFKKLVGLLQTRLKAAPAMCEVSIPDTIEELNARYKMMRYSVNDDTSETVGRRRANSDVQSESDVERFVLETLIYSSLYLEGDKYSKYQAFNVLEKYPEKLVRSVWNVVHSSGNLKLRKEGPIQARHPFRVPGYQLSRAHYKYFEDRFLGPVYGETKEASESLETGKSLVCGIKSSVGAVVLMASRVLSDEVNSELEVPDKIASFSKGSSDRLLPSKKFLDNEVTNSSLNADPTFLDEDGPINTREFPSFFRGFLSLVPCTVTLRGRPQQRGEGLKLAAPYADAMVREGLRVLTCRTVATGSHVIEETHGEAVRRDASAAVRNQPELTDLACELVEFVGQAGVMGVIDWKLRTEFCRERGFKRKRLDECLDALCRDNLLYFVGKLERRIVARQHATKWCALGVKFRGTPSNLAEKLSEEFFETAVSDVTGSVKPETKSGDVGSGEDSLSLLDPKSFDPLPFICRPWHNVCAEVRVETAHLILNGIFCHVLWHPGVTLEYLTRHFSQPMQRIEILEMIEVLVKGGCIERRGVSIKPSWNLFGSPAPPSGQQREDRVYFIPARDALFRMSKLSAALLDKKTIAELAVAK